MTALAGAYSVPLVLVSVLIAVAAAYTALALAGRLAVASGRARRLWLAGGALAMGIGIWSMHFTGMLAFRLHAAGPTGAATVPMTYGMPLMLLSVLVAVAASALALQVMGRRRAVGLAAWLAAGTAMGGAIAGMHYLGMASMHVGAALHYRPSLVVASLAVALVASFAALGLAFRLRDEQGGVPVRRRLAAALVMGLAIVGMHYVAMAAAVFTPRPAGALPVAPGAVLATDGLAGAIAGGTLAILALALLGVALDRWMQGRLRQEQAHRRLWQEAEAAREAAVRAAAEAEAANRARSDFLATMSHELRTPLNAIGGYVELLALGLYGPVSAEQQATFERVQRAQRHLLGLINDVLNFAKLEAGSVTYVAEDVSVTRVLEDVHAILAPQFALAGVAYDDHQARCHAVLRADREKVQQILLNLLGNAVKFTPSGGQVTITCAAQHEAVLLRVRDTGIGIPADKLEAVFQPFVQVGAGLTREHGGTGLGLAISRDLARAMGGDLTVESRPGEGSTFTLRLPSAAAGATAGPRLVRDAEAA